MNERERRLVRLHALRHKQHEAMAVQLRLAQSALLAAERSLTSQREAAWNARACREGQGDQDWDFLLACAESELHNALVTQQHSKHVIAATRVHAAALDESDAKRDAKQMECILNTARAQSAMTAARLEQKQLDESFRLRRRDMAARLE